jgi:RNA polymerase sigma factor (TIGR02999 family)
MPADLDLTRLLDDWVRGDQSALAQLTPLVYPQLHTLASSQLRNSNRALPLQTTEMVNELFLKLLVRRPDRLESRQHFYALAAKMIRTALVDHYRQNRADKRGGGLSRVPLHEDLLWIDAASDELLDFEQAMQELEGLDRQQADLFGMRFLLGCTSEEAATLSGLSKATVDRKIKLARAWLFQRMKQSNEEPADS